MEEFHIGDLVETIDDVIRGRVIALDNKMVTIETSDGFPMRFEPKMLIRASSSGFGLSLEDEHRLLKQKEDHTTRKPSSPRKNKVEDQAVLEVDLHIDKLISHPGSMSVNEILDYQIDTAKRQLEFALKNKTYHLVFIHGVGSGILKSELQSLLRKYPNILYRDANFRKYGMGAIEVRITRK
jgi:dsDNA-specific endonuclease/ATPase MutS2